MISYQTIIWRHERRATGIFLDDSATTLWKLNRIREIGTKTEKNKSLKSNLLITSRVTNESKERSHQVMLVRWRFGMGENEDEK